MKTVYIAMVVALSVMLLVAAHPLQKQGTIELQSQQTIERQLRQIDLTVALKQYEKVAGQLLDTQLEQRLFAAQLKELPPQRLSSRVEAFQEKLSALEEESVILRDRIMKIAKEAATDNGDIKRN